MTDLSTSTDFRPKVCPEVIDQALRATHECARSTCATHLSQYRSALGHEFDRHHKRLVYAIAQVVLCNHVAARRELNALARDAAYDAAIIGEVISTFAQIGDMRTARDLALLACARFEKNTEFLNRMMCVFELCADLHAAHATAKAQLIRISVQDERRGALERKVEQYERLFAEAHELGIGKDDPLCIAECFVDRLRKHGKKVRGIELLGITDTRVLLFFLIDATYAECAVLLCELAREVADHFHDTKTKTFVLCDVMPFEDDEDSVEGEEK